MGFLRKKVSFDMPPLTEEINTREPSVLDKQEQDAIDREIKTRFPKLKGRIFPKEVVDEVLNVVGQEALHRLARMRLVSGDLKGAASTCAKSLKLFSAKDSDWLLLAEIFAEHGDIMRARGCINTAKKFHKKKREIPSEVLSTIEQTHKISPKVLRATHEQLWQNEVQRVEDVIRSK